MLTKQEQDFLVKCVEAARSANHVWPEMAACEAALESAWGKSKLAIEGNNLFGQKQSTDPIYETISISTREYLHGQWVNVPANWVKFPTLQASFESRMSLLAKLTPHYPHYASALISKTPEDYVTQVSLSWSTDPQRAAKVITIFTQHQDVLHATTA